MIKILTAFLCSVLLMMVLPSEAKADPQKGSCWNYQNTAVSGMSAVTAAECFGFQKSGKANGFNAAIVNPSGTPYVCNYAQSTRSAYGAPVNGSPTLITYLTNNFLGGTSCSSLYGGKWMAQEACPAGSIGRNAETGFCIPPEDLVCDIEEALLGLVDETFTETALKPRTAFIGEAFEYFCSANCEVMSKLTVTAVDDPDSNNLYLTNATIHRVIDQDCDDVDPDSNNMTENEWPEWLPDTDDEDPDDPDEPDDPDGPDDPDDPDDPPTDDPPPPPPPPDFCSMYPSHPSCNPTEPGTSGAVCGGPGLPPCNVKLYGNTGVSSAFCTKTPSGGGDQLLVAILMQQWRTMCATEKAGREVEQEIKLGTKGIVTEIKAIGEKLEGLGGSATFVAPGSNNDLAPYQAERDVAKQAFFDKFATMRTEAANVFGTTSIAAAADLACSSFTVMNRTYQLCFDDYEPYLIQIGDALFFMAHMMGFFWLTKKD